MTERLRLTPGELETEAARRVVERVAEIWRTGGTVAFPTETVYGLGANAFAWEAVEKIFAAKRRPAWDPLIVHVTGPGMLGEVTSAVPPAAQALIEAFWPGPLTLLLPKSARVPDAVTAGRPLVGVRTPAHPVARALLAAAGLPIAAPSANSFGRTSPTTAEHVLEDLDGRIDALVDGGPTMHGLESTVVDASRSPLILYRPGVVTAQQLEKVAGPVVVFRPPDRAEGEHPAALPSPGVGMRHYAPRARLIVVEAGADQPDRFERRVQELAAAGERVGVLLPEGWEHRIGAPCLPFRWGMWEDADALGRRLFLGLRELDRRGATCIVCPLPEGGGVTAAIRDRLAKAARNG